MENAWSRKRRDRTMQALEYDVPDLVRHCTLDLKFLLAVIELDELEAGKVERESLIERAWALDQAGYSFEVDQPKFQEHLASAREFIATTAFEEYRIRFERYIQD